MIPGLIRHHRDTFGDGLRRVVIQRILDGGVHGNGSLTAGQACDARDFLDALADAAFTVTFEANAKPAKAG